MGGLRPLKSLELLKILNRLGFEIIRQSGSHIFLRHPNGKTTTVPMHRRKEIDRHLLRRIIREIGMELNEFLELT
ncbi:MAG: type II toxin-antitoxin system HicA family toxin [Candidatus Micrarchaeota archaeon]